MQKVEIKLKTDFIHRLDYATTSCVGKEKILKISDMKLKERTIKRSSIMKNWI